MYPVLRELVVAVKANEMTRACGGIQAKARHVQTFYSSLCRASIYVRYSSTSRATSLDV